MSSDTPCVLCGKIAVLPPFCLGCMLEMTDEEYTRKKALHAVLTMFPDDEGSDCKMCGKPNVYGSLDGMCSSCRAIWNG